MDPISAKGGQTAKRPFTVMYVLVGLGLSFLFALPAMRFLPQPYSNILVISSPTIATLLLLVYPRVWFRLHLYLFKRKIAILERSVSVDNGDLSEEARKGLLEGIDALKARLLDLRAATLQPTHEAKSAAWIETQSGIRDAGSKMLEILTVEDERVLRKLSEEQQRDLAVKQVLEKLDPA